MTLSDIQYYVSEISRIQIKSNDMKLRLARRLNFRRQILRRGANDPQWYSDIPWRLWSVLQETQVRWTPMRMYPKSLYSHNCFVYDCCLRGSSSSHRGWWIYTDIDVLKDQSWIIRRSNNSLCFIVQSLSSRA